MIYGVTDNGWRMWIAFCRYHGDNPDIYRRFVRIAYEVRAEGRRDYSADYIAHAVRWETEKVLKRTDTPFKISNNHVSFYARLFLDDHFCNFPIKFFILKPSEADQFFTPEWKRKWLWLKETPEVKTLLDAL